jgi:hypothetical protein
VPALPFACDAYAQRTPSDLGFLTLESVMDKVCYLRGLRVRPNIERSRQSVHSASAFGYASSAGYLLWSQHWPSDAPSRW